MKIKSKEIAEALGLSPATVSLALNNKSGVNENTKKRVWDYLKTHEAGPRQTDFIKWIIYIDVEETFSGEVRAHFETGYEHAVVQFQRARMEVKLIYVYNEIELEAVLNASRRDGTAGIILRCDEFKQKMFHILEDCKIPLVLEDSCDALKGVDVLNFNNRQAVWDGMNYLKQMGMRKILYLRNCNELYNFRSRRAAFTDFIQTDPEMEGTICEMGWDLQTASARLAGYLKAGHPDAVFLENYHVSMITIRSLEQLEIKVPRDLALLGIDEVPGEVIAPYQLTHFEVPHICRSYYTAKLLLERIQDGGEIPGRAVYLHEEFFEGDSVGKR